MANRPRKPDAFDSPWKDALQAYFPSFLAFFFADIHADIDWSRGHESLDKEFQQIVRRAAVGKRLADKLFKVWLLDGSERWLLIHVEIQGAYEKEFPERMFDYHIAIRRLYNKHVVGLAVLCDDRPKWRPTSFLCDEWGCRIELTFRIAKLLDHAPNLAELESSDNPIATLVLAHLVTMQTRDNPLSRSQWKLRVKKGLYRSNWSKEDVRRIFRLIDWVMTLPDALEEALRTDIYRFEEEKKVKYITTVERAGIKKGLEKGLEKGTQKGLRLGLLEGIELDLDAKFGAAGRKLMRRVRALSDVEALRAFARFLKTAETLEEVRSYVR